MEVIRDNVKIEDYIISMKHSDFMELIEQIQYISFDEGWQFDANYKKCTREVMQTVEKFLKDKTKLLL